MPFDAGYTTIEKVCTPDFADACAKLGLRVDADTGVRSSRTGPPCRPAAPYRAAVHCHHHDAGEVP